MFARRTATRIKKGTAQKKNGHTLTPNYWNTYQDDIQIDIENPGKGYKHFLKKRDIKQFLEILPNRGENYAESYAFRYEEIIWSKYFEYFPF